jgi:tetratricopeptide (TPR) repeat protein
LDQFMAVRESRVSLWRREWLWALLLTAVVFIVYNRVFPAGFIWDDESHLTRNPCVVGPFGLKEIWTTTQAVYYPLVLTSFWALHKFVGLNPLPYHFVNVFLHATSAIVLWRVLCLLRIPGAWLGAALWALHPVMVQSVAWVTELKNTQSCLFYVLSIFFFLKFQTDRQEQVAAVSSPPFVRSRLAVGLSLLCFLLATLSKPSVVMLPFVLALCIWWTRGKIRWRDALTLVPFAVVSAVASAWTIWEQKFHAGAVGSEWAQTVPERFIIAGRAICFYLGKVLWPNPLVFIYPRWEIHPAQVLEWLPSVSVLAGLVTLSLVRASWGRALFFGGAYYVISLFPVLGFFSVYFFRYSFVSDHFQYLASMGPLALAGAAITLLGERLSKTPLKLLVASGLCGGLLFCLAFLTWRQTAQYHDVIALYTATLKKNPGCWMAQYNLGIAFNEQGNTDEAIAHYRQAVALRPDYAEAHYNLGRLLAEQGRFEDAIAHYEKALAINPLDAEAQNNLGVTLLGIGRVDDAIVHYQKALEIKPDDAEASCNLANALIAKGDFDGAIAPYLACLAVMPDQAEAQYNLASALLRTGRTDEAIVHYEKALQLQPQSADAHANLGIALVGKGRVRDAIVEYRKALQISSDNVAALSNLAWLLATSADSHLRNGSEAITLAERADSATSRSDMHAAVLRILAAAYAEAGRFVNAKETARRALEAANVQGNSALAGTLHDELALYDLGLPYHK